MMLVIPRNPGWENRVMAAVRKGRPFLVVDGAHRCRRCGLPDVREVEAPDGTVTVRCIDCGSAA